MNNKEVSSLIGLAWHGRLFRDIHFVGFLGLKADDKPKAPTAESLNNS